MSVSVLPISTPADSIGLISVPQLLRLARRRAWLIALCTVTGGVTCYIIAHLVTPLYTASSLLSVDSARFLIPQLQGAVGSADVASDPEPAVRTEVQAISSQQLVQQSIDALQLQKDPEFNPTLRPPSLLAVLTAPIQGFLASLRKTSHVNNVSDSVIMGAVNRALKVEPDKKSTVIELNFTSRDPQLAADFLNRLVQFYIGSLDTQRRSVDQNANAALKQQLLQVSGEIKTLQQRLQDVRAKTNLVGLPAGSVRQQQMQDLATAADQASVQRAQIEATWQNANSIVKQGNPEALANVLSSPTISQLREQESSAMQRVADLTQRYGSEYPGVLSARADVTVAHEQLEAEARRIVASLAAQLGVARAHEAETKRQLETAQYSGLSTADAQAQVDQLQEEIDARHKLYESILQGLQQSDDSAESRNSVPQVRVLSAAIPPGLPSYPNKFLAGILGTLGGGFLGLLLTVVWRRGLPIFDDTDEAAQVIGLPVLASLPRLRGRNISVERTGAVPGTAVAEELRVLRMRVMALADGGASRTIVFTSAHHAEDSANVAAAFAKLAATDGERVLLIEGNFSPPCLGHIMGIKAGGWLTSLQGKSHWRDQVIHDTTFGLDLLLPGHSDTAPHNLLAGALLRNILQEAAEDYTLIVISGPSLIAASYAMTLAGYADTTIVVIDVFGMRRDEVSEAVSRVASTRRGSMAAILVGL